MACLTMTAISLIVSLVVVKLTAPCVVKEAMMKDYIAKQIEVKMIKNMLKKEMLSKKMEMEMIKSHSKAKVEKK